MIEFFYFGEPIGKVPCFVWRKGTLYLNFLRRIYLGKTGAPLPEYLSLLNIYRSSGGFCIILANKHLLAFTPWPRLIKDE